MRHTIFLAALLALVAAPAAAQPAAKPTIPQVCTTCHKAEAGNLRGVFENAAFKSRAIQLRIDSSTEILRFDPGTLKVLDAGRVKPAEAMRDIPANKETRVEYVEKDGVKLATLISVKGPIQLAPEKLVKYEEVERLVALGPEQGGYTLIDSRPLPRVQEGTIPTSINLPYPAFDKFVDRLPKDKSRLTIFFCQGVTCVMSPSSMKRAEAIGYTNVRVYREGYPEWAERNVGVIAAPHFKEAFLDKGVPNVLIDARPASTAQAAFIPGAVSIPPSKVREALAMLPAVELAAPIVVYDIDGGSAALAVARVIKSARQKNVTVMVGGFDAWSAAKLPVATGALGTKIAYTPKPRAGSISNDEFLALAKSTPADVIIVDVRNADETGGGSIRGARLVPESDITARLAELPKDKRIVTYCSTGVRAEMAYHKLKEAGYNAGFVYAALDIKKNGDFKLSPK